ncbi:hypothetical protein DL89DRAFT_867 [Linderina pennispora]|uniref:Uncharacterized protein n=1 Tax=Linderina pennispora TaxID=61395 RepID=A0A1Y1WJ39_9FUNG|nr:uncharacterized protein DL89DRAFT_867 [Linderina pennispora]ORX73591.1 hypothetical protein DL89DRAFT_867 [Linderina pennispora]
MTALDSPVATERKSSGRQRGHSSNGFGLGVSSKQVLVMNATGDVMSPSVAPPQSVLRMSQNRLSKVIKLRPQAARTLLSPGIRGPRMGFELQTPTKRGSASLMMSPSAGLSLASVARRRHMDRGAEGAEDIASTNDQVHQVLGLPASASRRKVNTSNDSVRQLKRAFSRSKDRRLTLRLLRYGLSTESAKRSSEPEKQGAESPWSRKWRRNSTRILQEAVTAMDTDAMPSPLSGEQVPQTEVDSTPAEIYVWAMLDESMVSGKRKLSILPGNYYMAQAFLDNSQSAGDQGTVTVTFRHTPGVQWEVDPSSLVEFSLAPTDLVLARRVKSRVLESATVLSVLPKDSAAPTRVNVRFNSDNVKQTVSVEEVALHTSMVVDDNIPEEDAVPDDDLHLSDPEMSEEDSSTSKAQPNVVSTAPVASPKRRPS